MKTPNVLQGLSRSLTMQPAGSINLMAREGSVNDIQAWLGLHQSLGIPYSTAEWRLLPEMWKDLFGSGRLKLFLVEDRVKSPGSRIVSCCAVVFATDKFCAQAFSRSPPFLGIQLVRSYQSGEPVILSGTEIAHANGREGLNLIVCFEGPERGALLGGQYLALHEKRCEAFHLAIAGYRIKEFLANPMGEQAYQEMIDAGARLRCDCAKMDPTANGECLSRLRPRVVGLTKEEAEFHPGSYLAGLFVDAQPRFHFSQAQQELLQRAMTGETCEDLAMSLSLSPWTVKKRWHAIYERVAAVDEELLPPPSRNGDGVNGRGAERRRRLLSYLRQHPEELRPLRDGRLNCDSSGSRSPLSRS